VLIEAYNYMSDTKTMKNEPAATGRWGNQVGSVEASSPTQKVVHLAAEHFAAVVPAVPEQPAKLVLTVKDCANRLSVSEKTILRLIHRGKLRCISSIRHKRVAAAELARFIREN